MYSIRAYGTYEKNYVRTIVTHENDVLCPKYCDIRQCYMSEPMLPTKISCLLLELTLHTIMCNVQTSVTHEYEMHSLRMYVTYRNEKCPNVCYPRKYDVLCPNLYYIRKCVMSEPMLHKKI